MAYKPKEISKKLEELGYQFRRTYSTGKVKLINDKIVHIRKILSGDVPIEWLKVKKKSKNESKK